MLYRQVKLAWPVELCLLALLTLLFYEWLLPLPELTATHSLPVFLSFFIFVFLVSLFSWPWYIHVLIQLIAIMHILHYLYFSGPVFSLPWLGELGKLLGYSFLCLLRWDFAHVPFEVRTLFFLLSIWYVAAYLYLARWRRKSIFTFLVMTTIYLATLDTFTPYQAGLAVFRVLLFGFLYLSILEYLRLKSEAWLREGNQSVSKVKPSLFSPIFWVVNSLLILSMATLVGVVAPKAEPQWPDPIAFLQRAGLPIGSGMGTPVQKVGYGENDAVLGGGFVQDDSVAFYAITPKPYYWRGESKDVYTGKGWEKSPPTELFFIPPQREPIQLEGHPGQLFASGIDMERGQTRVYFTEERFSTLFYQGDVIQAKVFPHDLYVQLDPRSGRFTTWEDEQFTASKPMKEYIVESAYPQLSVKDLLAADERQIPEPILKRYTQLPEGLPSRIGELALEITAGVDSQYDRVKKIEQYFRENGFRYETKDVPVPGPEQDYVDQFLFETKRGYCDNFSTAMVVMLRTLDIPARWVKGFTFGEIIEEQEGYYYIQVLNRHAHSWVEVYFPGVGWVPFEPTQTFTNPYSFVEEETDDDASTQQDEEETEWEQERMEHQPEKSELEEEMEEFLEESTSNGGLANYQLGETAGWKWLLWLMVGGLVFGSLLYFSRYRLLGWLIAYHGRKKEESSLKEFEWLIHYLGKLAVRRKPAQTLREYVLQLEKHMDTDWVAFTRQYERWRYGQAQSESKKDA